MTPRPAYHVALAMALGGALGGLAGGVTLWAVLRFAGSRGLPPWEFLLLSVPAAAVACTLVVLAGDLATRVAGGRRTVILVATPAVAAPIMAFVILWIAAFLFGRGDPLQFVAQYVVQPALKHPDTALVMCVSASVPVSALAWARTRGDSVGRQALVAAVSVFASFLLIAGLEDDFRTPGFAAGSAVLGALTGLGLALGDRLADRAVARWRRGRD